VACDRTIEIAILNEISIVEAAKDIGFVELEDKQQVAVLSFSKGLDVFVSYRFWETDCLAMYIYHWLLKIRGSY